MHDACIKKNLSNPLFWNKLFSFDSSGTNQKLKPCLQTLFNNTVHQMFNLLKPTGHVMHHQFNIQQM